jgi:hypothetical protein
MLPDLQRLHEQLSAAIADLADLTAQTWPDRAGITRVRWKLSRASRLRLKLLEETVYPFLLKGAIPEDARHVSDLRRANAAVLAASREHIATWTIERVIADWSGYRAASADMRALMTARIQWERKILYTLLDQAETDGRAAP